MHVEILYRPSYSLAVVKLSPSESVMAESGAMVSMSHGMTLETQASGGIIKSLARSFFGGESFWQNLYTAPGEGGEITFAPPLAGDMFFLDLDNESLIVQSGSFVACEPTVSLNTKWGGAKMFFASEGLTMLQAAGKGKLILSSYGAIHEKNLGAGELLTVDTGHLVAFTEGVQFNVRRLGNLKSTILGGEGLVVDLAGPGRVLIQTRSTQSFLSWLFRKLPKRSGGGT